MTPKWTASSDKHGVARPDQAYAIAHRTYVDHLPQESIDDGEVWLFIGPRHAQALPEDEIEVLVNVYSDGRPARIFHAMPLGPKFRRHREENPHD
ncbi:hypothetical protein G9U51_02720 [Calidifontibacter sp. DB0510]|uniref:Uncharacterized protein n=1 Tax=Metallococcus carri TaxID=1656884 RepID=A0A967E9B6_9MICO|nr:hypothetical protein [Metallococcus carri]NHN54694.1 hypothetical protein [Metallococcus carri]NOP37039.1 hypothetical protein [Calidifontibacter sp. DB2511S]